MSRMNKLLKLAPYLTYNGFSNWSLFQMTFQKYAKAYDWSKDDCLNCVLSIDMKGC